MLSDDTAGVGEVATALGRSVDWLKRNWLKIHIDAGFPRKHPTGWTWPRAAVVAWLRAPARQASGPRPANDNPIHLLEGFEDGYAAALEDRYGGRP